MSIQSDIKSRVSDLSDEPVDHLLVPIQGYEDQPLLPLNETIKPISKLFNRIEDYVFIALHNCQNPVDGLDQQESASIHLYTMQFSGGPSLYQLLNQSLRDENRNELKPWFLFLKLFLTALYKLPSQNKTVWRGIKNVDLSSKYKTGTKFAWWGVSSCTTHIEVLESEEFLGKTGERTLFSIECFNGKSIINHSYFKHTEKEVILIPGSYFQVISQANPAPQLHIIHLKEIEPPIQLVKPPFIKSKNNNSSSIIKQSNTNSSSVTNQSNTNCSPTSNIIEQNSYNALRLKERLSKVSGMFVYICIGIALISIFGALIFGDKVHNQQNKSSNVISKQINPSKQQIFIPNLTIHQTWKQHGTTKAGGHGQGNGLNQFYNPCGVFIDDDQTIYVADYGNHRIVEWKSDANNGRIVAGGNGRGNRNDQLNRPTKVILDKENDSLIICDRENRRVVRWPRRNSRSGETLISNIDCRDLIMDNDEYLYVSDDKKHEVRRWKVGEKNGIIIAGGNGQGNRLDQLTYPSYIFIDEDHSVYVSDHGNHRVMKWVKDAKEGIVVAGGQGQGNGLRQLSSPHRIIVDQLASVYVADCGNHRVIRWLKEAQEGTIVVGGNGRGEQPNQFHCPIDLSFDRQKNLYVVEWGNHRVQKFDVNST